MSLVTLGDHAKVLLMVTGRADTRDRLLLSLSQQATWTDKQRALVERIWQERQSTDKEATMKQQTAIWAGLVLMVSLLSGCAGTYEKRFTDHDGKPVVIREHHDPDWWNNLGTPDWMNVRHETITRDGQVIADRHCTHQPTQPTLLDCTGDVK